MSSHVAEALWATACGEIESRLSEKDFHTWILALEARSFDGQTLVLGAPFGLFRDRVKQSFLPVIETCVSVAAKCACEVTIEIGQLKNLSATRRERPLRWTPSPKRAGVPTSAKVRSLHEKTFDGFLVGESNRLAYLGARQLAEATAPEGNNLLFLYGGAGLGKAHLLLATAHALRSRGKKALYYRSGDFVRHATASLESGRTDVFHAEIRTCDALLLSKVQLLSGKQQVQQELCRAMSLLHQDGKLVVITSDRSPAELDDFDPELQRQFASAPFLEVGPLDQELRLRILRTKLTEKGLRLEEHVLERLATQLQGSVREIEGLASHLQAANGQELLATDGEQLETLILPHLARRGPVDLDVIIDNVAWMHGLTRDELLSRDRSRRIAWPRHNAAYLCRKLTKASLPEIGVALGGRNHTSILRAVRSVTERQLNDSSFASKLQQLEKAIGSVPALRVA